MDQAVKEIKERILALERARSTEAGRYFREKARTLRREGKCYQMLLESDPDGPAIWFEICPNGRGRVVAHAGTEVKEETLELPWLGGWLVYCLEKGLRGC